MTDVKKCSMCGGEKSLEEFRTYPNGSRYPYCLECQTIETRRKYLEKLDAGQGLSVEHQEELNAIRELYELRVAKGLKTFGGRPKAGTVLPLVSKQKKSLG